MGINTFPFTKGQARPPLCWYCKWERVDMAPLFPKAGSPFHTRYSLHFLVAVGVGVGVRLACSLLATPTWRVDSLCSLGLRALPWAPSHGCSW